MDFLVEAVMKEFNALESEYDGDDADKKVVDSRERFPKTITLHKEERTFDAAYYATNGTQHAAVIVHFLSFVCKRVKERMELKNKCNLNISE